MQYIRDMKYMPSPQRAPVFLAVKTTGAPAGVLYNLWANGYVGEAVTHHGRIVPFSFIVRVEKGVHLVAVSFMNDHCDSKCDRNLFLGKMTIEPEKGGAAQPTKGTAPANWIGPGEDVPFVDFTEKAGLTSGEKKLAPNAKGGTLCDYDGDSHVDLAMGGKLYRNTGTGRFEKTAVIPRGNCYVWADYDNDGDLDLFVGGGADKDRLLRNDGPDGKTGAPRFTDVSKDAGIVDKYATVGGAFGDYDNDGDLDLYLGGSAV